MLSDALLTCDGRTGWTNTPKTEPTAATHRGRAVSSPPPAGEEHTAADEPDPQRWREEAACLDRWELSDAVRGAAANEALRLCAGCPVLHSCETWVATQPAYEGVAAGSIHRPRRRSTWRRRRSV